MSWTDYHTRYFRNRSTGEICPTCDDEGCPDHSSSQFYYGEEDWEEVRITPVDPNNETDAVTAASEVAAASIPRNMADVIEEAARVGLEALDEHHKMVREAVRKACNFDLGPDQDRSVEVWTIALALADAGLLAVTPVVTGDVIEQAARMLHTLQWDGEQEDAESAWDHYPILAVARQEYLRTAEALADAGLLAGSRTVTPEQREAAEAVLMTSPHMLLLSPGTIAKIVDTVLTAVGLTVEEGGRG